MLPQSKGALLIRTCQKIWLYTGFKSLGFEDFSTGFRISGFGDFYTGFRIWSKNISAGFKILSPKK